MRTFFAFLMALLSYTLSAQEAAPPHKKSYAGLSGGMAYGYLRDAGVSPLTYSGPLLLGMAELRFEGPKWEWWMEFGVADGNYEVARSFIVNSSVTSFYHSAGTLRRILANSSERLQVHGSLSYRGFTNYRLTPAFRNNSSVIESLNSLMLGARLDWQIHKTFSAGKWLLFKRKGGPRNFRLASQIHFPLIHTAWRPDFAYLDDFTAGSDDLGASNLLKTGGFRLLTQSEAWYYMRNGNAWRISYLWDIQRTPGTFNRLETAQHLSQISLMVRLN